jgi:hypothetical protein
MKLNAQRVDWRLPLVGATGASILLLSMMLFSADGALLYLVLVAPLICLVGLVLLLTAAVRKRYRHSLSLLVMLLAIFVVSAALLKNQDSVRASLRWLLYSRPFKAEVLAQPPPASGELRHVEWEATGFAGMSNTVYLVFDPTDSLGAAAKSHSNGKFNGIPCKVPAVRRLESQWYSVRFYTDEEWGVCNQPDGIGLTH